MYYLVINIFHIINSAKIPEEWGKQMPTYFSITFSFKHHRISNHFVSDLYQKISEVFPFKSGYWDAEDLSYDDLVNWNQAQLTGDHEDSDLKQVLFQSNHFSELRGIWYYTQDEIEFELIMPENEILRLENHLIFVDSKMQPLRDLAISLWINEFVDAVQAHDESVEAHSLTEIEAGLFLADQPFAIIEEKLVDRFPDNFFEDKELIPLNNNGALVLKS